MYYADEIIEEIRYSNDIVEVVSEYVSLEKKGRYYFGLCPFHKEKTPSFSVTPSLQIFNCFGCSKGGNVIQFIMNIENLDFVEAVKLLAEKANIILPETGAGISEDELVKKKNLIGINKEAARFYYNYLTAGKGKEALEYLSARKIMKRTIKKFGLGLSPLSSGLLLKHLNDKGYEDRLIVESGLAISGNNGIYERFRGRIMFPIFDIRGNVIGFGGRVVDKSKPKYMNSPETMTYNKRKNLYGLNYAKNSGNKNIIVVEGYMDVISLHQSGIINSVASLGTALTESQGRILKKYFDRIIICYDSDAAGKNAAMRGLDLLNDIGCNVKVLEIPNGKDPDDFIRNNGADRFNNLIEKSSSLAEYKIRELKKNYNIETTDGRVAFVNKMAAVLAELDNKIEMEMYLKKLAGDYGVSEESIYAEIIKLKGKAAFSPAFLKKKTDVRIKTGTFDKDEKEIIHDELLLIAALCLDNNVYGLIKDDLAADDFTKDNRVVLKRIFERLNKNERVVAAEVLSSMSEVSSCALAGIIDKECNFDDGRKPLDIVTKLKKHKLMARKKEIFEILKNRESLGEGDVEKFTRELNVIVMQMKNSEIKTRKEGFNEAKR